MNKIIKLNLVLFLSIIISGLNAQNSFKKTENYDKQTLYFKFIEAVDEAEKDAFEATLFSDKVLSFSKLFPAHHNDVLSNIFCIRLSSPDVNEEILQYIQKSRLIEYAEYAPIHKTFLTPNDLHINQWHLKKIMAEQAWTVRTGNAQIKLAIVDDGVDTRHPDLSPVMYVNTAEIAGNNIDDDNNGYIDDRFGWNAHYQYANPNPPIVGRTYFSHGTHCAGIAAAATNNNLGIASIGYNISIIPVACSDSTQPGYIYGGYEGIVYAVDAGAQVISLSWGGSAFSITGQTVINYAISKNVVVCAAAGNDNSSLQKYPAAYNGVISVAATNASDQKASFSNYGSWIDVSAPGASIYSSVCGGSQQYDYKSGTSMACPLVAGLCGLMLSQNASLSPAQLEACLKSSCDNIYGVNPNYQAQLGTGRINAYKALNCIKPLFTDFSADKVMICSGNKVNLINLSSTHAVSYWWTVTGAGNFSSTLKDPSFTFTTPGFYHVKLRISDGVNSDSLTYANYIEVYRPEARMRITTTSIKRGESAFLSIDLIGQAPFNVTYTDGSNNYNFSSYGTPYYLDVQPLKTTTYRLVSMMDAVCNGVVFDSAKVLVDTSTITNVTDTCNRSFSLITKTLDFGSKENPHHIERLRDGNIAIVGVTNKGSIGGDDIFLSKLRADGALIWTKYYGTSANEVAYPISVFDDNNFNIYIGAASYINNPNTSLFFKLDSSGNIQYARNSVGNGVQDQVTDGMQLSNGNILYVGTSAITSDQAGAAFVMDNSANYVWKKSYNTGGQTEHNVHAFELNKKIYMLGRTSNGAAGYGSYYVKMDLSGNTIWQKYIDYSLYDAAMYQQLTHQNTILDLHWIAYNNSTSKFGSEDIGLVHLDTNGNKIWSKIIGTAGKDNASGLTKLNNYYYISGITNNFDAGKSKLFLIKIDINGNIKWSKIYGATGESITKPVFANHLTTGSDGSLLVMAQKTNTTDDIVLFKIDECGNSNCPNQNVTFQIASDNTSFSNASLADINILGIANTSLGKVNASGGIQVSDKCPPVIVKKPCTIQAKFGYSSTCYYDSVYFIDSSTIGSGKRIKSNKWVFHNNTVITGKSIASFKYSAPGTYPVKLIVFPDTSESCTDTFTMMVTVGNQLFAKLSSSATTICNSDSVQLTLNVNCAKAPYTVQWQPAALFKNPNSFSPKLMLKSSTWLTYTLKDANGLLKKDSIFITVNPNCCVYVGDVEIARENYCVGQSSGSILNAYNYPGATYKWYVYLNQQLIDSVNSLMINNYVFKQAGLYRFKVVISGSCKGGSNEREVFVHPLPYADAGKDTLFCNKGSYWLGMDSVAQMHYDWTSNVSINNNLQSRLLINVTQSATYYLKVTDLSTGCINTDSVRVLYTDNQLSIGNDTSFCLGTTFYLRSNFPGIPSTYKWSTGSGAPSLLVSSGGRYILTQTNVCGTVSDTVDVKGIECICEYSFPNAFSPDGNAINEYFPWEKVDFPMNIQIYNRWGEKLWDAENTTKGWDGRYKGEIVQQDVYLYIIYFKNCKGRYTYHKGTFTVLR